MSIYENAVLGEVTLTNKGAVTQGTSITTGVTLNKSSGVITTVSSTIAAGSSATFTLTNNKISNANAVIIGNASTSGTGTPEVEFFNIAKGSCSVLLKNSDGSAAFNNTIVINFHVIRMSP